MGQQPIDPLATQLVLENNWPRVPVEQSGEASDMMRTGSVPARRRFELIRLAQRKVSSPWQNFPRSLESPQTRFDVISIYSQWAVFCPANSWRSGPGGLSCPGRVFVRPTERFANCREE